MRITRDMEIAGVPAIALRDALKRLGDYWSPEALGKLLGVPQAVAEGVCSSLVAEGYLSPVNVPGEHAFHCTTLGNALANASATKPIKRSTAESLVRGVIERAQLINGDDQWVLGVRRITAFGSYVGESEFLGDVDLAVELVPKFPTPQAQEAATRRYTQQAAAAGRRFRSTFEEIMAPQLDIFANLRAGSRYISLHEHAELAHLPNVVTVEVFRA